MKSLLGLAALIAVVFGDDKGDSKGYIDIFVGTYEFEVLGRPHRLYLCDTEDEKTAYWAIADRADNEYTVGMS